MDIESTVNKSAGGVRDVDNSSNAEDIVDPEIEKFGSPGHGRCRETVVHQHKRAKDPLSRSYTSRRRKILPSAVDILEGKIEGGRRGIGRKTMSWLRNIRNWTGISSIGELCRAAETRSLRLIA